ncbi:uncharacterized protein V2V93DRAFT_374946 [Kockiozyma suomiensis]|uniref:uncharacterized protein n=1 Tax=Kockiozyma suomiensis TaxID=1337062 RepID=UPI003343E9AA
MYFYINVYKILYFIFVWNWNGLLLFNFSLFFYFIISVHLLHWMDVFADDLKMELANFLSTKRSSYLIYSVLLFSFDIVIYNFNGNGL